MTTTDLRSDRTALESLRALDPDDIETLPWRPVLGCPGVEEKELWRFDGYVEALVRYAPGARSRGAAHLAAHHHVWVVCGAARIAGRWLPAGSYLHIPPGRAHAVEASADGCVLLQMHRPHAPQEAEPLLRHGG